MHRRDHLLATLQAMLEMPAANLRSALTHAADVVAQALAADKVDAFLYDATRDSLVAIGVSNQPLSALQRQLGLDVLQLSNGGRVVHVFKTGQTFLTGRLDADDGELIGIREALAVRSAIGVPLLVGGSIRGALMIASLRADYFEDEDVAFAESIARWVGMVAHRAELVEEIAKNAHEHGRRAAADELMTMLAHDMRNYVAPIDIRLHTMLRRAQQERREHDVRDLIAARRSMSRMVRLISDILDVSRIDRGIFNIEVDEVDISALVEEAAAGLSTPEHAVIVRSGERMMVAADVVQMRQCLENIISNGLKHSPSEAPVTVLISRVHEADGEWAHIEVIDEGTGVPPEVLPHIFDRFVTSERSRGGLGLGLYLAKRVALMHGGDLTVRSPAGRGASFTLRLPCAPTQRQHRDDEDPARMPH